MPENHHGTGRRRQSLELALPVIIVLIIGLGWYVTSRYAGAIEQAVVASYQETQLEIVRAIARSAELYLEDELAKGTDQDTIEQTILKRFVAPTHLHEQGDAWIYAPDHVVFDRSSDFPPEYVDKSMAEIFSLQRAAGASHYEAMSADVMSAREGVGWYVWLPDKGREIAAWTPVGMAGHVWTIGLSTPLSEIMAATGASAQIRFMFAAMVAATLLGLALTGVATLSMLRRRRAEHELQVANGALEGRVAELRREVEERERAERAAKESEHRYRTLLESAGDGIVVFSDAGEMVDVNPATCAMYGATRDQLLARPPAALLHTDYAGVFEGFLAKARAGERFRGEAQGVREDDSLIEVELTGNAYQLGDARYLLLNLRDISERVAAEREKKSLEAALARSKKMEALGLLAGAVAHDLNNILGGVVSLPDLLMADLGPRLAREERELIETIKESGTRAAAVVSDLMTVAKGIAAPRSVLSLNDTVHQYLLSGECRDHKARFSGVRIKTALDPDLGHVKGIGVNLQQALINLVVNAAEAVGEQGTIRISTRNEHVTEQGRGEQRMRPGQYAVLAVSDDGPGIAPEHIERIFEPFYTSKRLGRSGAGLGLAIVWNAVQDHDGYVEVKSGDEGTTFELYLPVTREPLSATRGAEMDELLGAGERVLVVDDEPSQRTIACKMLTSLGYTAEAVSSGEQAIEYVKDRAVDLVVLDMIMDPGINGRRTYEQLVKLRPGQKAVIASGYAESDEVRLAQRLGAGEYIKKPYTMEMLARSVKLELRK
ncbi:hybrid sensor histidine kinase/response regulator [Haliangium sp.]|uniref:hybrid sensor histidine kinase/response regulator n=1 Tax=Haliangium sp. TaxID=2663208 RepID=UPI003D12EEF1